MPKLSASSFVSSAISAFAVALSLESRDTSTMFSIARSSVRSRSTLVLFTAFVSIFFAIVTCYYVVVIHH